MKSFVVALCLWAACASGTFSGAQSTESASTLPDLHDLIGSAPAPNTDSNPPITLEEAERIALAENPEIAVAARRVALAQAHLSASGTLDDPMAMYRGWGVPLKKPWDYNAAQNMFSLSQTLPGGNKRALQTSIASSDVDEAKANLASVQLDVKVRTRKAFYDLLLAEDEMRIHAQHASIARQAIDAARIKYTVGNVPQQDVLKAQVALTGLAEHMIRFDRDAELARAHLNTLLGREPASPLSVSGEHAVLAALPSIETLESMALDARPDLVAMHAAAERSQKERALAKKSYAPDFTFSAGYMLMPSGTNMRNDYMVEGSMNLPWLNRRKHDAEIAEATAKVTEQDAELVALRNAARGQIEEALLEAQAAQRLALIYRNLLRPQAEATLQASVIAYENNKTGLLDLLDSQMTVVNVDLAWIQAVGEFDARLADLELATGASLDQSQQTRLEVKP